MNASRKLWLAGLFGAAAVTVMSLGFAPASLFADDDDDDKGPSEKALAQSEAQIPSETLKTPFEKEVPIRFVTSTQNKAVWDKLKDFWNSSEEKVAHPKTGKEVTRKVVLIKVPLGLQTPPPVPPENPITVAKFELGKKLYFDKIISANNTVSCASCHNPAQGFTDQSKVSTGISGKKGGVSAPSVYNSAYSLLQFWDGRAATLEAQSQGPPQNPSEMFDGKGHAWFRLIERISKDASYVKAFEEVFGHRPTRDAVAKAIATYERLVLTGDAVADRAEIAMRKRLEDADVPAKPVLEGKDVEVVLKKAVADKDEEIIKAFDLKDEKTISEVGASIARGKAIFLGKARCNSCHVGDSFTDSDFHNLGVGAKDGKLPEGDLFRFGAQPTGQKNPALVGATKTPPLRQLLHTAPYMHDGSEATLEAVVDFYDKGGNANPTLDIKMRDFEAEKAWLLAKAEGKTVTGPAPFVTADGQPIIPLKLGLTPEEKKDLVNYLKALNGVEAAPVVLK